MAKSQIYTALICCVISITTFANIPIKEQNALRKSNNQLYQSSKNILPMTLDGKRSQGQFDEALKKRNITLNSLN